MKKFEIHFINSQFFTADNTVKAFASAVKRMDGTAAIDPKLGSLKNCRILYVRSGVLTSAQLREFASEFIQGYDHLTIKVIVK